tara:strand:+ start:1032 stop:1352 length:321 start_codon:yes stop_codon:yes gene_type:complete
MIDQINIKKMHHRDPQDTELAAAVRVVPRVAGMRRFVLQSLESMGGKATGTAIAKLADKPITSIRPRLTELLSFELIEDSGQRELNQYENNEIIWKITKEGKKYVD